VASPGNRHLAAGYAPGVDVALLQVLGDPLELPLVQACPGRVDLHARSPLRRVLLVHYVLSG